jgi:hypothetical protein
LLAPVAFCAAALALAACGDDDEADDRAAVRISFDEEAYVDAATPTPRVLERVRRQTESVLFALHAADVAVTRRKLVDVDLAHLKKDPVTVVDESGITRDALRLRYHFVALGDAPAALASKGVLRLGALHEVAPAQTEIVRAVCTANGVHERTADLWTVFNASLERCAAAIAREQAAIDAARKALAHPSSEIVTREFERLYVPVAVRLVGRERPDGGSAAGVDPPVARLRTGKTPRGAALPSLPGDDDDEPGADGDDDEEELSPDERPVYFGPPPRDTGWVSSGAARYMAPNFAVLYFTIAALILLLVGGRKRGWGGRRK